MDFESLMDTHYIFKNVVDVKTERPMNWFIGSHHAIGFDSYYEFTAVVPVQINTRLFPLQSGGVILKSLLMINF